MNNKIISILFSNIYLYFYFLLFYFLTVINLFYLFFVLFALGPCMTSLKFKRVIMPNIEIQRHLSLVNFEFGNNLISNGEFLSQRVLWQSLL